MESKMKMLGHPMHPMLITFPVGLLATSLAFDIVYFVNGDRFWARAAFWLIASGLLVGLAAGLAGWADWWGIPANTRAKRIGLIHGLGNVAILAVFGASWFWRLLVSGSDNTDVIAIALSAAGVGMGAVTVWLGGELVDRLGVGVYPGANLDATNSLSAGPAGGPPAPPRRAERAEEPEHRRAA